MAQVAARQWEADRVAKQMTEQVLRSEGFHAAVEACLGPIATKVVHAPFKSAVRACNKTKADYLKRARPEFQFVTDVFRATGVVDNFRELEAVVAALDATFGIVKLKDRLDEGTHDVLVVVKFEGWLGEVQLAFASVELMKSFSHAAYSLERIDLEAPSGFKSMLDALFTIPKMKSGLGRAGGYETRPESDIALALHF